MGEQVPPLAPGFHLQKIFLIQCANFDLSKFVEIVKSDKHIDLIEYIGHADNISWPLGTINHEPIQTAQSTMKHIQTMLKKFSIVST